MIFVLTNGRVVPTFCMSVSAEFRLGIRYIKATNTLMSFTIYDNLCPGHFLITGGVPWVVRRVLVPPLCLQLKTIRPSQ